MWTKRFAALLVFLVMPGLVLTSSAQKVFANGGAVFADAPTESAFDGARTTGQVGVRLPYTDLFTLEGAVSYGGLTSLEGVLQFHPFERISGVQPYAFAGFGRYLSGNDQLERSVVPLGVGAEVPLGRGLALDLEVGGRWALATNDPPRSLDLYSGIAPTVGISYDFSKVIDLPDFGGDDVSRPPLAEATPAQDGEAAAPDESAGEERPPITEEPLTEEPLTEEPRSTRGGATGAAADAPQREGQGDPGAAENAPQGEGQALPGAAENAPRGARRGVPGPAQRAPEMRGRAARMEQAAPTVVRDTADEREMMELPAGTFVMGLTDEDPLSLQQAGRKRVSVTPFMLDKFEVSNEKYRKFLQELAPSRREEMRPDSTIWEQARSRSTWQSYFRGEKYADFPVVGVTYEQAQGYCQFYGKRLPTEAEWEYAARGDLVGSIYPWPGYEPRNVNGRYLANYNPNRGGYAADGYAFTAPGDAYPPSSWGLYHMSGNVAEWVQDAYHPSYSEISDFNPVYEDPNEERHVVRGGSWSSNAFYIGVGVRDSQAADKASPYIGFRCASSSDASSSSQ